PTQPSWRRRRWGCSSTATSGQRRRASAIVAGRCDDDRSVGEHRADVGLCHDDTLHLRLTVKPPHGVAAAERSHVIFNGVAGHYRLAELALVDGEEIDRARLLGALDRLDAD